MAELIRSEIRVARKHHDCTAWYWFCRAGYADEEFTADERLVIDAVRADRGRILPGQQYMYQVSKDGGEIGVFKARLDMNIICCTNNLYPED